MPLRAARLALPMILRLASARSSMPRTIHRPTVLASVGGMPPGEPPKKNDDNDNHWWKEIKASLKAYLQATKGASRKQIARELLKGFSEAQIAEIEAALARAEQLMGENVGRLLPPP